MAKTAFDKARGARQIDNTWVASVRRMRVWVDGDPPYRPWMIIVLDQDNNRIRRTQIFEDDPTASEVLAELLRSMHKPLFRSGGRSRPTRLHLDDAGLVEVIAPRLAELDVICEYRPSLPALDALLREFNAFSDSEGTAPALVQSPGMTLPLAAEFYAAAASYYQQAPWNLLSDSWPVEVRYPPEAKPCYAVVMGQGGETYGVAIYNSLEDLKQIYAGISIEQISQDASWLSVMFDAAPGLSFDDLDAIEANGWPVAGDLAYPLSVKIKLPDLVSSPNLREAALLAAVLRVLPDFVTKQMRFRRGIPDEADAAYFLSDIHGNQEIALSFPAGEKKQGSEEDVSDEGEGKQLEDFIEEWYWDEKSLQTARQLGGFLLIFLDDMIENSGLSEKTIQKHIDNAWNIGYLLVHYADHATISPGMFLNPPMYLQEFRREFSSSKSAVAGYQATWRKAGRYVRALAFGK